MFKIGEFSKLSRISIRMLRHYDEIGLLVPEETDPWTGYRRYAAAQLMTANRITALRAWGSPWQRRPRCWPAGRTGPPWRRACWPSGQRWRPPFRRHWTGCGFWTQPSNG